MEDSSEGQVPCSLEVVNITWNCGTPDQNFSYQSNQLSYAELLSPPEAFRSLTRQKARFYTSQLNEA